MILCTKSAALARCVLPQRAAKPVCLQTGTDLGNEKFISAWRDQEIADWGGRGGRREGEGGRAQEVLVREICANTAPTSMFKVWEHTSLLKSGESSRRGYLLAFPPCSYYQLGSNSLKQWQQPGLKCRLKMFIYSIVREQLWIK